MIDNKELTNILILGMNMMSPSFAYNWSDAFALNEAKEAFYKFESELNKIIDWDNLTNEDCDLLRFGKWSSESNLRLIPLYLWNIVPEGLEVTCISGETTKFSKELDNDIRFGSTAYGIIPKE